MLYSPFSIQVEGVDDLAQDYFRLEHFEFSLDEVGVKSC